MAEPTSDEIAKMLREGKISKDVAYDMYKTFSASIQKAGQREFAPNTYEEKLLQLKASREHRAHTKKLKIPFITENFLPEFYLSQGLVLIGGVSGNGKSTVASNILAGFLLSNCLDQKQAYVITNEENVDSVLDRTSCVLLQKSYHDFFRDKLSQEDHDKIIQTSSDLCYHIQVIDDGAWDMTCLEDVISVLEYAARSDAGIVLIDYLQTVTHSKKNPEKESVQVSKDLGFFLKSYGRRARVPIVTFAQLKPKSVSPEFKIRVQNDGTIFDHSFQAIEIIPDFDSQTTLFKIHKDRNGFYTNKEVTMLFKGGRYVMEDRI